MARWAESKAPASTSRTLPPPASSAGVPRIVTSIPTSSATRASPNPAPTADAAITLWPQAWPIPGKASYSAQITTRSGPLPATARTAVASPP